MVVSSSPRRIVLTGAPGAGKTALVTELARRGLRIEPEAARVILQQAGGIAMRADHPLDFALAMFAAEEAAFHAASAFALTIFDRGLCDTVGFLRLEGRDVPPALDRACRRLRYDELVFRAPHWPDIYRSDAERIQTPAEAVESDRAVTRAWQSYGYTVVDLPFVSVTERADALLAALDG